MAQVPSILHEEDVRAVVRDELEKNGVTLTPPTAAPASNEPASSYSGDAAPHADTTNADGTTTAFPAGSLGSHPDSSF